VGETDPDEAPFVVADRDGDGPDAGGSSMVDDAKTAGKRV
jgi:hypothetical protein